MPWSRQVELQWVAALAIQFAQVAHKNPFANTVVPLPSTVATFDGNLPDHSHDTRSPMASSGRSVRVCSPASRWPRYARPPLRGLKKALTPAPPTLVQIGP